jgi:hypothetical protein
MARQNYVCGPREFSNTFNLGSRIRMDELFIDLLNVLVSECDKRVFEA